MTIFTKPMAIDPVDGETIKFLVEMDDCQYDAFNVRIGVFPKNSNEPKPMGWLFKEKWHTILVEGDLRDIIRGIENRELFLNDPEQLYTQEGFIRSNSDIPLVIRRVVDKLNSLEGINPSMIQYDSLRIQLKRLAEKRYAKEQVISVIN